MLYCSIVLLLISIITLGQDESHFVYTDVGSKWTDTRFCDSSEFEFCNDDPNHHAVHRDGADYDEIEYCYYGEFDGEEPSANECGWSPWQIFEGNSGENHYEGEVELQIGFRLWAYCNWQPSSEEIWVTLYDEFSGNPRNNDQRLELNRYNSQTELIRLTKRDRNCQFWNGGEADPVWLDSLSCDTSFANCYHDYLETLTVTGPVFALEWRTTLDEGDEVAVWAWSDVMIESNGIPEPTPEGPFTCCTPGPRNDVPPKTNKFCSAYHERRNCQNKDCSWDSENDSRCQLDCCRYDEPEDKDNHPRDIRDNRLKCKNEVRSKEECESNDFRHCVVTECDRIGTMDGTPFDS